MAYFQYIDYIAKITLRKQITAAVHYIGVPNPA